MVPTLIRGAGMKDFKCTAAHRRREGNNRSPNSPVCPGCQPQPRVCIRIYVTPAWAKPPKRLLTLGLCLKSQTREVFPGSHLKPPAKSTFPLLGLAAPVESIFLFSLFTNSIGVTKPLCLGAVTSSGFWHWVLFYLLDSIR